MVARPSGAAMTVDFQPPIGTRVMIGKTPAQVVRLFAGGLAVEFMRVIPPEEFSDNIIL